MFNDPQFWVFIAFIIFIGVIFKPVRKIFSNGLDVKIQEIKHNINEAEKLKNEAQLTLSEIKKRQNEVKGEIDSINQDAKNKIAIIEKNTYAKLKNQMSKLDTLASIKIDQIVRETNTEIQKYITQIAISTTISILEKKLDDNEKQNLINQSVTELNSVLKN